MNTLVEFLSFSNPSVRMVTLGTMMLGAAAALVGCFAFLRKRSLIGDAVAHAILPGIVLAFVIGDSKNPLVLMAGALVSGWLALVAIDFLTNKTKLKADAVIGLVLSVFFGFGIVLLTAVQQSGRGSQAGLDKFLFGKAASMTQQDVLVFGSFALILAVCVFIFYKIFKIIAFNRDYAVVLGLPVRMAEFALNILTILAITTGIQAVGVVLMAALLITPAAASRAYTESLPVMLLIAAGIGALGGFVGSFISFSAPNMPTGPWIVVTISFIALLSLLFAPKRGVMARLRKSRKNREKIITENVLKAFFLAGERQQNVQANISLQALAEVRDFPQSELNFGLKKLQHNLDIAENGHGWQLTDAGLEDAKRVVRLHRLWEMYLAQRMNLKSDHIHPNAETMEHLITPELEKELIAELDKPEKDPHESVIPY